MNTNDAVSTVADRLDEQDPDELPEPAGSALRRLQPYLGEDGRSATFAAVTGAVSLVRGIRTLRKGKRNRGLLQLLTGVFWVGLAVVQRSRTGSSVDQTDVAETGPDIEDAADPADADPGEPDEERATGEEVVDTTDADLDESDLGPDVDQTDVAETGTDIEDAAESDEETDEEAGTETAD